MSILIVGSVALDTVETPTGKVEDVLGGAANYAAVAASFFHPVQMVAVVGEDFPDEHLEFLKSRGIDLSGLQIAPGKTFRWHGRYLANMMDRETLDTQLNVFEKFDPVLPDHYREPDLLFLANIHPALQRKVLDQIKSTGFVACDTMNLWINTAREELLSLLPRLDLLFVNDEEARLISREHNLLKAARHVIDLGVKKVIVKRGEHGSTLITKDSVFVAPAFPLEHVMDPTGAGDCFAGGFMGELARNVAGSKPALLEERSIRRAMIYGSVLASFDVESFSLNRLRSLDLAAIETRVQDMKKIIEF